MAIKPDELIRYHNEGAAFFMKLIEELGYEEAKRQLSMRIDKKISICVKPEIIDKSTANVKENIYNNMVAFIYTVLHDEFGFGKDRMLRFKKEFDLLAETVYETSPMGHNYLTIEDLARGIEEKYNLGVDITLVHDMEQYAYEQARKMVDVNIVVGFLKERGFAKAAQEVWEDVNGSWKESTKERTKEFRAIAKQQMKHDKRYKMPNMNIFDADVNTLYMTLFSLVLGQDKGFTGEDMADVCNKVNEMLNNILYEGKKVSNEYSKTLLDEYDIEFSIADKEGCEEDVKAS